MIVRGSGVAQGKDLASYSIVARCLYIPGHVNSYSLCYKGVHSGAAVCILDIDQDSPQSINLPSSGKPYGLVRFLQVDRETCVVDVTVQNLTPGDHGIHIHEYGDTSNGSINCGPHFNPTNVSHGDHETGHVGDLGNITVDEKGWGDLVLESKRIKVWDIIGRSMVVTNKSDDLGKGSSLASKQDGGSGQGVICGIVARSAGVFENTKKICDCSGNTLWEEARIGGEKL